MGKELEEQCCQVGSSKDQKDEKTLSAPLVTREQRDGQETREYGCLSGSRRKLDQRDKWKNQTREGPCRDW